MSIVVHDGAIAPIFNDRWDPSEVNWIDFLPQEGLEVESVTYEVPEGWEIVDTREDVTVTYKDGTEYSGVYSVALSTTHTRNYHIIGAIFSYTNLTVDPVSVKVRVNDT